jgi:rhodanese-related sulfurtransferase
VIFGTKLTIVPQAVAVFLLSAAVGFCYAATSENGLLGAPEGVASLQRELFPHAFVEIRSAQMISLQKQGGLCIVDARQSEDYLAGHLPGAVNIPAGASAQDRARALAGVGQGASIVVYCQSAGCPFAALIAERLHNDGFSNLSIYRDGWVGWERMSHDSH